MGKLAGIRITNIDWCIEEEDVWNDYGNQTDDETKAEIEEIKAGLPKEVFIEADKDSLPDTLAGVPDILSDQCGWLVNSFDYNLVDMDGKVLV